MDFRAPAAERKGDGMSENGLNLQTLAKKLATLYVDDYVGIAKLCDETIDRSGGLLQLVRDEAAKIGLPQSRQKAREAIGRLCSNPEMWATHGRPSDSKLKILEDEFTAAFELAERTGVHKER